MLIAAYAPLLALMAVLDTFGLGASGSPLLRWMPAAVGLVGVVVTVAFVGAAVHRRAAEPEVVFEARPREGEAIRFFATYVVPFFILQAATPTHRWALIAYLVLIAALYLQSEMFAANPVLALLGYRVFELNRVDGGFLLVLTRSRYLAPREVLDVVPLGGYVHVHRRIRERPDPVAAAAPAGEDAVRSLVARPGAGASLTESTAATVSVTGARGSGARKGSAGSAAAVGAVMGRGVGATQGGSG